MSRLLSSVLVGAFLAGAPLVAVLQSRPEGDLSGSPAPHQEPTSSPAPAPASEVPMPTPPKDLPGSFRAMDPASGRIKLAAGAIQKELSLMTVRKVEQAAAQVVAGMNYRLVCQVQRGDAMSTWEFIIWSKLDGTWELTSARKL